MPKPRIQINFPVKDEEMDLIKNAQIGLMIRDQVTYNRKETLLILCHEFLQDMIATRDKKSA